MVCLSTLFKAASCCAVAVAIMPTLADEPTKQEEIFPILDKFLPAVAVDQLGVLDLLAQKFLMPLGLTTPLAGLLELFPFKLVPNTGVGNYMYPNGVFLPTNGNLSKTWGPDNWALTYVGGGPNSQVSVGKSIARLLDPNGNPYIQVNDSKQIVKSSNGIPPPPAPPAAPAAMMMYDSYGDGEAESPMYRRHLRGERAAAERAANVIRDFSQSLRDLLGETLDVDSAMKSVEAMPPNFIEEMANIIGSYGGNFLEAVEDGTEPLSAMIQQLAAPLEGDGVPFLIQDFVNAPLKITWNIIRDMDNMAESVYSSMEDARHVTAMDSMNARRNIIEFAKDVGRLQGEEMSYASLAASFIDEFLIPSGLTPKVAQMIQDAWPQENRDEALRAAMEDGEGSDIDMSGLLDLSAKIGSLLGTQGFHMQVANSFGKLFLAPLNLLGPVTSLLSANSYLLEKFYTLKSALLNFGTRAGKEVLVAILTPKALAAQQVKAGLALLKGIVIPEPED